MKCHVAFKDMSPSRILRSYATRRIEETVPTADNQPLLAELEFATSRKDMIFHCKIHTSNGHTYQTHNRSERMTFSIEKALETIRNQVRGNIL